MVCVGIHVEGYAPVDVDVLTLPEKHYGGRRPEHRCDARGQDTGSDGVALSGFLGDRIAQWNPLVVDCPDAIDGKVQLARAAQTALLMRLCDDAGDPWRLPK